MTRRSFLITPVAVTQALLLSACAGAGQSPQVDTSIDIAHRAATSAPAAYQPAAVPTKTMATQSPTQQPQLEPHPTLTKLPLPEGPVAPFIQSEAWINSAPLAWDSLRGKVVMVEFWTFG
jgi:hypothetical protein